MFYRRKVLLSLMEIFEGELEKIRLQKLLLIFTHMQEKPSYDFIPYKFGCFSFSANADLNAMVRKGVINDENNRWKKEHSECYSIQLRKKDQTILQYVKNKFKAYSINDLIRYTYLNYPFYAINSQIAEDRLSEEELKKVKAAAPCKTNSVLYTIGYEGISFEKYLKKLLIHDVKILCDVRNNAQSMKYGFSKKQLQNACKHLGIKYIHLPKLDVQSSKLKSLDSQLDYDKLFQHYIKENIPETIEDQEKIIELLKKYHRVALTCFEADICQCHRKPLAEAIIQLSDWKYELKHI